MSSMRTATVVPNEVGTGGFGRRNDVNLNAAFGGSPIGKTRTYNEDAVKNAGISVLNGGGGPGDARLGTYGDAGNPSPPICVVSSGTEP